MKFMVLIFLVSLLCAVAGRAGYPAYEYRLQAPLEEYARNAGRFDEFARDYERFVEAALQQEGLTVEQRRLLQASRVHLAIRRGDEAVALDAAMAIRAMMATPAERTLVGLTTRAWAVARRTAREAGDARFQEAFAREYNALLQAAEPPPSQEQLNAILETTEITGADYLEAFLNRFSETAGRSGVLDLTAADQLARVRHKMMDMVPLNEVIAGVVRTRLQQAERGRTPDGPAPQGAGERG